ncbi:unnamed protein product [Rodentolepis nana]|uniref:Fibronectin type-III domain-containing protein n=1 Tax=Rodentolepis nana TaxID=102285 RepID=A0A0R3TCT4_RODNA|nr:unnamed protein product [Rodentolepis nana]
MSGSRGAQCSEVSQVVKKWSKLDHANYVLLVLLSPLGNSSIADKDTQCRARLTWIPPVMENMEAPTYRVFYFHDGALSMTITSNVQLEIPINESDTMIRAVVRTVTKSENWTGEYKVDPKECKFNSKRSNDCIFRVILSF